MLEGIRYIRSEPRLFATVFVKCGIGLLGANNVLLPILGERVFPVKLAGMDHARGAMLGMSMLMDAEPPRVIRAMVEKWVQTLPFVSMLFNRTGQVVGVPENCERLLEREELILAFPEMMK